MIPSKNVCPDCGSEDVVLSGQFGNSDAWICNECGSTDFASGPSEDDLDMEDMPVKKSKIVSEELEDEEIPLGEGNLIKASRLKAVVKTSKSKLARATKVSKVKTVKGRKKR